MKAALPASAASPKHPKPKKITLPNVSERRRVHILNPASGNPRLYEAARRAVEKTGDEMLISEKKGGITALVADLFCHDPFAHAVVYGGDGTVYETVNGMMQAGAGDTASFSLVPAGSGNDFSACANDGGQFPKAELTRIDLIRTEMDGVVRYCANMLNAGFDCDVVRETYRLKKNPLLRGKAAYVAGVAKVLLRKKTMQAKLTLTHCITPAGEACPDRVLEEKMLLCACANGQYYGGGFLPAPLASLTDGYFDVLTARNLRRMQFVSMVGAYHDGTFLTEDGTLLGRYNEYLTYQRCRELTLEGPAAVCLDGEVMETGADRTLHARTEPQALWFAAL